MKYLLAFLLALLPTIPAQASDWRLVGDNTDYPAIIVYLDRESVQRYGDNAEFIMIYYVEGSDPDKDVGVRQQLRAQCSQSGFQILSEQTWIGSVEQPAKTVDPAFQPAAADSLYKFGIEMVCGTREYGMTIADPDNDSKAYFDDLAYGEEAM